MKTNNKFLLVIFLLINSVAANAQARPAMCRIFPLWKNSQVRSSYTKDIGSFKLDGEEGETLQSFRYKDELIITASINFLFDYSKKPHSPYEVRLAITASDKEEKEIFEMSN